MPEEVVPYYTEDLADECGYSEDDLDGTMDELIDYKNAVEDTLNTVEARIRGSLGMTLAEWLDA